MSYWRFAGMIATSTLVMFGLMYLNTFLVTHVFFSETRTYMAILMGGVMAIIMLAFMLSMYRNRSLNIAIFIGSAIVVASSLWLVRSQVTVGDVSFMRAMIPHHSIAIMTSSRANIEDSRVRKLADEIIYAQDKEIAEMRYLIAQIEAEGPQTNGTDTEEARAVLVSAEEAISTPNVAVMDAGFLTPADIAQVYPDGASCTFAFTTQSPAALAVGETSEGRSALLKIGGSLVQLTAAESAGQFSAPGMTASLEKLDDDWRADGRLRISLAQGLTAGYDGFSDCAG